MINEKLKNKINQALSQGKAVIIKPNKNGLQIKPDDKTEIIYLGDEQ